MKKVASNSLNRRQFLGRTAAAALPFIVPGAVLGLNGAVAPSNRITFGGIGIGNRARAILPNFLSFKEIAVPGCERLPRRPPEVGQGDDRHALRHQDCRMYPDFRELLAQKDIDAVFIATGDRWQGTASVYAARGGKDIYSEKPVSMTISEGRTLVGGVPPLRHDLPGGHAAAFHCLVSVCAAEMVRQGKIGRVQTVEMQVWTGPAFRTTSRRRSPKAGITTRGSARCRGGRSCRPASKALEILLGHRRGPDHGMGCHYTDQMQWAVGTGPHWPGGVRGRGEWPDPAKFMSETPVTAKSAAVTRTASSASCTREALQRSLHPLHRRRGLDTGGRRNRRGDRRAEVHLDPQGTCRTSVGSTPAIMSETCSIPSAAAGQRSATRKSPTAP